MAISGPGDCRDSAELLRLPRTPYGVRVSDRVEDDMSVYTVYKPIILYYTTHSGLHDLWLPWLLEQFYFGVEDSHSPYEFSNTVQRCLCMSVSAYFVF